MKSTEVEPKCQNFGNRWEKKVHFCNFFETLRLLGQLKILTYRPEILQVFYGYQKATFAHPGILKFEKTFFSAHPTVQYILSNNSLNTRNNDLHNIKTRPPQRITREDR